MPHTSHVGILSCLLALGALSSACSSSSETSSTNDGSGQPGQSGDDGKSSPPPSCTDVCTSMEKLCDATPPSCESACGSFTDTVKRCVVDAKSCNDANACGSSSQGDDGGTGGTGNPCDPCTKEQFCVQASSVESEIGCFDPPSTCNGSSTKKCDCMFSPATGPCSKGATNCSEGLANTVICQ